MNKNKMILKLSISNTEPKALSKPNSKSEKATWLKGVGELLS